MSASHSGLSAASRSADCRFATPEAERIRERIVILLTGLVILLPGLLLGLLLRLLLTIGLRILDRVIGRVDLVHFLRSRLVAGIQIGMVLLCQPAVRLPDLVLRCVGDTPST